MQAARRLPWRPARAAVLLALTVGLLAGLALVWRGLTAGAAPDAPLPTATFDLRQAADKAGPPARAAAAAGRRSASSAAHATGAGASPAGAPPATVPSYGPGRLGIPALGVDAAVVPEPIGAGGDLVIPGDPAVVGRWAAGPAVNASAGTTVLAGHVSVAGIGGGALQELYRVAAGDLVVTTDSAGEQHRWRVEALEVRHKDDLPTFAAEGPRRLAIVTCGGPALAGATGLTYRDNVIAYAAPAAS